MQFLSQMNDVVDFSSSSSSPTVQQPTLHTSIVPKTSTSSSNSKRKNMKRKVNHFSWEEDFSQISLRYQELRHRLSSIEITVDSLRKHFCIWISWISWILWILWIAFRDLQFLLSQHQLPITSKHNKLVLAQSLFELIQKQEICISPISKHSCEEKEKKEKTDKKAVVPSIRFVQTPVFYYDVFHNFHK